MSNPRIASSITQADLLADLKPLLDRIGASENEIVGDIHLIRSDAPGQAFELRFNVVASPDPTETFPDAVRVQGHPQGDEFAIWTHQINVAVLYS